MIMPMKRFVKILLLLCVICISGCGKISDIKFSSCKMVSCTPTSLRSLNLKLNVEIDNPSIRLNLSQMQALVYRNGKSLGTIAVDPLTIAAHTTELYDVTAHVSLDKGTSLHQIMSIASDFKPEEFTADVHAKVKLRNGLVKTLDFKDVKLSKFVK